MKFLDQLKRIKSISAESFDPKCRQTLVALGPLFLTVSLGMTSGYSAILLPQLEQEKSDNVTTINVTKEEASWIASIAALPMAFGCVIGGFLMEKFGRKTCHLICTIPFLIGWLSLALSQNLATMLTGRFLTGICAGLLGPATGVYIGETSQPNFRGLLLAAISLAISLGLLLVHLLGTFYSWRTCAYISAIFPIIGTSFLLLSPESPAWLAKKNKTEEATKNFHWCRGFGDEAKKELSEMIDRQQHNQQNPSGIKDKLLGLKKREFFKPLVIIVVFIVSNQWAGVNALTFYGVSIMKETVSGLDGYLAVLIIDVVRVVMSVVACAVLKRSGRRPLALVSGVGTFSALFVLSSYAFLAKSDTDLECAFVPMAALVAYIAFVSVGFVPLPWAMMGEVFPSSGRNVGSTLASMMAFLAFFSVVKSGPAMFDHLGTDGTFAIYGGVALIGTVFVYFFLPETKDKPLHEIEDGFRK